MPGIKDITNICVMILIQLFLKKLRYKYKNFGNNQVPCTNCKQHGTCPHSHLRKWFVNNCIEIYVFIAITMLIVRNKHLSIAEYWSTDPSMHAPIFSEIMPWDRYILLLRLLHFSDNDQTAEGDKLKKKLDLILISCFASNSVPFRNLCIDDSLMIVNGRL
ncbi:hypothetical protein PR048_013439 [Dryococelus australis]|uniref:PiggyBac transposable element-derived protein domain-containing protein n=1 Tax=Dryococelus australis TaxID=614101 RepID=A0ABQ9HS60_9NEOP|nr:hypothetical protein PR048_013439 [Dryococelus australis]